MATTSISYSVPSFKPSQQKTSQYVDSAVSTIFVHGRVQTCSGTTTNISTGQRNNSPVDGYYQIHIVCYVYGTNLLQMCKATNVLLLFIWEQAAFPPFTADQFITAAHNCSTVIAIWRLFTCPYKIS